MRQLSRTDTRVMRRLLYRWGQIVLATEPMINRQRTSGRGFLAQERARDRVQRAWARRMGARRYYLDDLDLIWSEVKRAELRFADQDALEQKSRTHAA